MAYNRKNYRGNISVFLIIASHAVAANWDQGSAATNEFDIFILKCFLIFFNHFKPKGSHYGH